MSLLRIMLRTVGQLLVARVISHDTAAAMVRSAWAASAAELMPFGSTSNHTAMEQLDAAALAWWCKQCPEDEVPWRVQSEGATCPRCLDEQRRSA